MHSLLFIQCLKQCLLPSCLTLNWSFLSVKGPTTAICITLLLCFGKIALEWYKLLKNPQHTLIHFIMSSIKLLTLSRSFPSRCNSNTAYHSKTLFLFDISICLAPNRNMKYKLSSEPCKACELHYPVWKTVTHALPTETRNPARRDQEKQIRGKGYSVLVWILQIIKHNLAFEILAEKSF